MTDPLPSTRKLQPGTRTPEPPRTRPTGKHRRSEAHHRRLMPPLPRGDTEAHGRTGPVGGVQSVPTRCRLAERAVPDKVRQTGPSRSAAIGPLVRVMTPAGAVPSLRRRGGGEGRGGEASHTSVGSSTPHAAWIGGTGGSRGAFRARALPKGIKRPVCPKKTPK